MSQWAVYLLRDGRYASVGDKFVEQGADNAVFELRFASEGVAMEVAKAHIGTDASFVRRADGSLYSARDTPWKEAVVQQLA
jgi:hypothetical protein